MTAVARAAPGDPQTAAVAVRRDGVVVIEGVWSAQAIDAARDVVEAQHPEFENPDQLHDYRGDPHERFIAPVTVTGALRATGVLECSALNAVLAALLGEDFVYEAFGMLMARAGAKEQEPHRDGGILFPEGGVDRILSPSALTVTIPLVDVNEAFAPTGVVPGSHRLEPDSASPLVPVELSRGSAAVWDFRTLHAGLANRTHRARPALYFTACRAFWTDHANFQPGQARLVGDPQVIADLGPRFIRARPA